VSAVHLGSFVVESPEWHAARATGLGGSEIAAVLGLSKWTSRYSLWCQKAGLLGEPKVNSQMTVGKYVEPAVIAWWQDQHPEDYVKTSVGTYAHSDRSWQIANPDGLVYGDRRDPKAILETKFAVYDYEWGTEGTDEIPPYYLTQCRWYLDVFGLDVCHVAVLFGGSGRFAEYVVRQDEADALLMRTEAQRFLDDVATGNRPDIDEHDATYEAIRAEHPGIERNESVELDADLWMDYTLAKIQAGEAERVRTRCKSKILDAMGDARIGTVAGVNVLRRQPGRGGAISLYPIPARKSKDAA